MGPGIVAALMPPSTARGRWCKFEWWPAVVRSVFRKGTPSIHDWPWPSENWWALEVIQNQEPHRPPTTDSTDLLCEVEAPRETGTWETGPQPTGVVGTSISRSTSDKTSAEGTSFSKTGGYVEIRTWASFWIRAFKAKRWTHLTLPKSSIGAIVYTTPLFLGDFTTWYTTGLHRPWILWWPLTLYLRK